MKKGAPFPLLLIRTVTLLILSSLMLIGGASAATIDGTFDASLTSGSLAGVTFLGSFSYDDSTLTGKGQEYDGLKSFNFTLLGTQFTESDIKQGGEAVFQDGVLQYVTAAFFPPPP